MARKTISGADFKAFYADPQVWGEDNASSWYVDDLGLRVEGMTDSSIDAIHDRFGDDLYLLPDDAKIQIQCGYLEWGGRGEAPAGVERDLQGRFDQWLDARTQVTFVATLQVAKNDHEALARIQKALEDLGAQVSRSDEPVQAASSSPKM